MSTSELAPLVCHFAFGFSLRVCACLRARVFVQCVRARHHHPKRLTEIGKRTPGAAIAAPEAVHSSRPGIQELTPGKGPEQPPHSDSGTKMSLCDL